MITEKILILVPFKISYDPGLRNEAISVAKEELPIEKISGGKDGVFHIVRLKGDTSVSEKS